MNKGTRVDIELYGRRVSHRMPGPWRVETFNSGFACVTNAHGINWISGFGGRTLFVPDVAEEIATALNRAGGFAETQKDRPGAKPERQGGRAQDA